MWTNIVTIICGFYLITKFCNGINFVQLPGFNSDENNKKVQHNTMNSDDYNARNPHDTDDIIMVESTSSSVKVPPMNYQQTKSQQYPRLKLRTTRKFNKLERRYWLISSTSATIEASKHKDVKSKINVLVKQILKDTNRKIDSVNKITKDYKAESPYKVGFNLSLIKKTRDVLNELFNVAVKHRLDWKALEQLKILELIVQTNVDTMHAVQLITDIHSKYIKETDKTDKNKKKE